MAGAQVEHGIHVGEATIRRNLALEPGGIPVLFHKIGEFLRHLRQSRDPKSTSLISFLPWARSQMLQQIPRHLPTSAPSSRAHSLSYHRLYWHNITTVMTLCCCCCLLWPASSQLHFLSLHRAAVQFTSGNYNKVKQVLMNHVVV